ncbi:MAG TPA: hypothetical protein VFQ40_07620, partial [Actinomycetota bacterium]|nr:hypothetical protein [Actinomycetota bacterium]
MGTGPPGHPGRAGKEADGDHDVRRRRSLEAPLIAGSDQEGDRMRLRKIAYALASLAALAMAVGAGWR